MRVAFVHDWLVTYTGAERVLDALLELFPGAPIYTLVYDPKPFEGTRIVEHPVFTSWLNLLPAARRHHRLYLPLMPLAVEQFDLRGYDLVISSSHAVAKGVITSPETLHVSYIHTPPRYAWDLQAEYFENTGLKRGIRGVLARVVLHYLRLWDTSTGMRPDVLVANSRYVARRIQKVYRREAEVIYPPVDVESFSVRKEKEDFYLAVSRMVPYKRMHLVVEAFSKMPNRKLVVIGDGPDLPKIRKMAGPNVSILGYQPREIVRDYMQRARAFVFAAEEDFGIAPVEAMACGTPVIAYGRGGVTETVCEGETGVFFHSSTPECLIQAIEQFERMCFMCDPDPIRRNAERYSKARFQLEVSQLIERFVRWSRADRE